MPSWQNTQFLTRKPNLRSTTCQIFNSERTTSRKAHVLTFFLISCFSNLKIGSMAITRYHGIGEVPGQVEMAPTIFPDLLNPPEPSEKPNTCVLEPGFSYEKYVKIQWPVLPSDGVMVKKRLRNIGDYGKN